MQRNNLVKKHESGKNLSTADQFCHLETHDKGREHQSKADIDGESIGSASQGQLQLIDISGRRS